MCQNLQEGVFEEIPMEPIISARCPDCNMLIDIVTAVCPDCGVELK